MASGCMYTTSHPSLCAPQSTSEKAKQIVGYKSVDDYVKSGMIVGLGTGSTAKYAVERLGQKLKSGELKNIIAIPTSEATKTQALSLGIPLATLNDHSVLDVTIDGADQIDKNFNMIKGGGGALLREKMVEVASKTFIVIADDSKLVRELGPGFPLPVEITPFCYEHTIRTVAGLPSLKGCRPVLRRGNVSNNKQDGNDIAITDNGNYIVDLHFDKKMSIKDALAANIELNNTVGVVEHGLFIQMASTVLVAHMADGSVSVLSPP
eukprot:CAMPEP_0185025570 /NCGR_PEP_ID=MMETSP1103-20130426/8473_1 /TAXON_ID=36769 /ORGANISM="Paraphysomonas bandaiensis, Strain Caron Lab Isolate" /LENGTH=264 /DNA_ID=CAMNT_0027558791 /DNA_START=104 /DNA_END=895 /DNA_ORIENTATION=+